MKKRIFSVTAVVVLFFLLVCVNLPVREKSNEYNPRTDYQYTYKDSYDSRMNVQGNKDGEFIYHNDFIYFCNYKTGKMYPLCSKANCLHDYETDHEKRKACNAFAPDTRNHNISYYDGNVYVALGTVGDTAIYRICEDGSRKDKIFEFGEMELRSWMIHRGMLYYVVQDYFINVNDGVSQRATLKCSRLSSSMSDQQAEVIYQSNTDITVPTLGSLCAYKDYVYFGVYAYDSSAVDEDYARDRQAVSRFTFYCYELEGKKLHKIDIPPECEDKKAVISNVAFVNDNIFLHMCNIMEDPEYKLPVYIADLDGSNSRVWMPELEQNALFQCHNGKIIITDADIQYFEKSNKENFNVEVYSTDAELVDSFVFPVNMQGNLKGAGEGGRILEFIDEEETWSVVSFDINSIGNYNGTKVQLETVATRRCVGE